jgi:hypothetical protein
VRGAISDGRPYRDWRYVYFAWAAGAARRDAYRDLLMVNESLGQSTGISPESAKGKELLYG